MCGYRRVIGGTAPCPRSQARDSSLPADTGEAPIHYTITRRCTTSRRWGQTSACLMGLAQGMVFTSLVELLVAEHRRDTWPGGEKPGGSVQSPQRMETRAPLEQASIRLHGQELQRHYVGVRACEEGDCLWSREERCDCLSGRTVCYQGGRLSKPSSAVLMLLLTICIPSRPGVPKYQSFKYRAVHRRARSWDKSGCLPPLHATHRQGPIEEFSP
jgi:hypothetical protein